MATQPARHVETATEGRPPTIRGIDHLALNTDDMAATIHFYTGILGMKLVAVARTLAEPGTGQPPHDNLRHYFFDMGNDSTIAFFEYPKGTLPADRDGLAAMQHCAFHVSRPDFEAAMERLRTHDVPFIGPVDRVVRHSIYFYDNNGIRLELTTAPGDGDFATVDSLRQSRAEAEAELATLFEDSVELQRVLDTMPLRANEEE